jgi:hypothetical protein
VTLENSNGVSIFLGGLISDFLFMDTVLYVQSFPTVLVFVGQGLRLIFEGAKSLYGITHSFFFKDYAATFRNGVVKTKLNEINPPM